MPDELSFVANENFDFAVVKQLRGQGFSFLAIAESFFSIADPQVLQIAVDRKAISLTEDKDFSELVHRLWMAHCGILLVQLLNVNSTEKVNPICEVIEKHQNNLANSFSVLSNDQLRIRPKQKT